MNDSITIQEKKALQSRKSSDGILIKLRMDSILTVCIQEIERNSKYSTSSVVNSSDYFCLNRTYNFLKINVIEKNELEKFDKKIEVFVRKSSEKKIEENEIEIVSYFQGRPFRENLGINIGDLETKIRSLGFKEIYLNEYFIKAGEWTLFARCKLGNVEKISLVKSLSENFEAIECETYYSNSIFYR
jgi:hypothetical protein